MKIELNDIPKMDTKDLEKAYYNLDELYYFYGDYSEGQPILNAINSELKKRDNKNFEKMFNRNVMIISEINNTLEDLVRLNSNNINVTGIESKLIEEAHIFMHRLYYYNSIIKDKF